MTSLLIKELEGALLTPFLPGSNKLSMKLEDSEQNRHFLHFHCSGRAMQSKVELVSFEKPLPIPKPSKVLDKAFYGGILFHNFGHFVTESLHRLWPLIGTNNTSPILFHCYWTQDKQKAMCPYTIEIFEYLGIDIDRVELINCPILVGSLQVPQQGKILGAPSDNPNYPAYFKAVSDMSLKLLLETGPTPEIVYVSRSNYMHSGSFLGESHLERQLEDAGVYIHYPEKVSVKVSLAIYKTAKHVIFSEGSAIHLLEILDKVSAAITIIGRRSDGFIKQIFVRPLKFNCDDIDFISSDISLTPLHWDSNKKRPTISMANAYFDLNRLNDYLNVRVGLSLPTVSSTECRQAVYADLGKSIFSQAPHSGLSDEMLGHLFRQLQGEIHALEMG